MYSRLFFLRRILRLTNFDDLCGTSPLFFVLFFLGDFIGRILITVSTLPTSSSLR